MGSERKAAQDFVRFARQIGAITLHPEGRVLKSGRKSPYFVNTGGFNKGSHLKVLGAAYADAVHRLGSFDIIYGPPYKGIPLCVMTIIALYERYGEDVGYAHHRKEVKTHGDAGAYAGHPIAGMRVCLVDDVITDGETKEEAIVKFIRPVNGIAAGLVVGFDRQERVRDDGYSALQLFAGAHKIPCEAAANLQDLIAVLEEEDSEEARQILPLIHRYNRQYGAIT